MQTLNDKQKSILRRALNTWAQLDSEFISKSDRDEACKILSKLCTGCQVALIPPSNEAGKV